MKITAAILVPFLLLTSSQNAVLGHAGGSHSYYVFSDSAEVNNLLGGETQNYNTNNGYNGLNNGYYGYNYGNNGWYYGTNGWYYGRK